MKQDLLDVGFSKNERLFHHTGIDIEWIRPLANITSEIAKPVKFLIFANFHERKGMQSMISTFQEMTALYPNLKAQLRIIGDSPYRGHFSLF